MTPGRRRRTQPARRLPRENCTEGPAGRRLRSRAPLHRTVHAARRGEPLARPTGGMATSPAAARRLSRSARPGGGARQEGSAGATIVPFGLGRGWTSKAAARGSTDIGSGGGPRPGDDEDRWHAGGDHGAQHCRSRLRKPNQDSPHHGRGSRQRRRPDEPDGQPRAEPGNQDLCDGAQGRTTRRFVIPDPCIQQRPSRTLAATSVKTAASKEGPWTRPGSRNSAATAAVRQSRKLIQASASRIPAGMTSPVPLVLSSLRLPPAISLWFRRGRTPQYCRPWTDRARRMMQWARMWRTDRGAGRTAGSRRGISWKEAARAPWGWQPLPPMPSSGSHSC